MAEGAIVPLKACSKCGAEKTLDLFTKKKTGKLGVSGECRACRSDIRRAQYADARGPEWQLRREMFAAARSNTAKRCTSCFEIRSLEEFHYKPDGLLGRSSACRYCASSIKRRKYREEHERLYRNCRPLDHARGDPWRCTKCKQVKPDTQQYFRGTRSVCRSCEREYMRSSRAENPEHHTNLSVRRAKKQQERARLVNNKVCKKCGILKPLVRFSVKRSGQLSRDAKCKDCRSADRREHWQRNAEFIAEKRRRQYRDGVASDPSKYKARAAALSSARRARLKGGGVIDPAKILELLERQKNACFYCKAKLPPYHLDHIFPLSRGGRNTIDNVVLACPGCNCSKGAKMPWEFLGGMLL